MSFIRLMHVYEGNSDHGGSKEKERQLRKTAVFRQLIFSIRES